METKFQQKIVGRVLRRLEEGGLDAALEYGLAVCGAFPHVVGEVVCAAPEPLKTMLNAALAFRKSRQKAARKEASASYAERARAEELIAQGFVADLNRARSIGQAAVFLAGLTMADRSKCAATKQELAAAIAMRRNCIRSTRVKVVLGCTETELKRWSEDGRLPVMSRRRMPSSSAGITLDVRHWDIALVRDVLPNLVQWRDDDALAKRRKRLSS